MQKQFIGKMDTITIKFDLQENGATATVQQLRDYLDQMGDSVEQSARRIRAEKNELADLAEQMKSLQKEYDTTSTLINKYAASLEKVTARGEGQSQQAEVYRQKLVELRTAQKEQRSALDEITVAVDTQKQRVSELSQVYKAQIKDIVAEDGSYNALNATLGRMRDTYRQLTEEERKGEYGKTLLANIKQVDTELKNIDATMGNHQRNVGNYASTIDSILPIQNKMLAQFATLAATAPNVTEAIKGMSGGIAALGKQLLALMANPIVALLAVVTAAIMGIVNAMKSSEEQTQRLSVAFAPLRVALDGAINLMQKVSARIVTLIEGSGKLAGKIMKLAEKIPVVGKYIKDVNDAVREGIALEQQKIQLTKQSRNNEVENAKRAYESADLRAKAMDKEKYSAQERLAFLKRANQLEMAINKSKLDDAQLAYDIAKKEAERTQNDAATNENLAKLEANLYNVRREYAEKRRALLRQENAIIKEVAAEEKKQLDEIAKLRKKVAEISSLNPDDVGDDAAKIEKKYAKERRIVQEAYDKGAIDSKTYHATLLDIDEKYFNDVGDLLRNQRKDWKDAYDKQVEDKLAQADQLAAIDVQQAENAKMAEIQANPYSLDEQIDAEVEYNNRIAEIEYERLQSHIEILQQQWESDFLSAEEKKRLENEITVMQGQQQAARLKAEEKNGKAREKIMKAEVAQRRATVNAIANILGGLSQALGEETEAGKAVAVASAMIQTYQAAQGAFTSALVPPAYGAASPYIAAVNMAAAIATGIANVKSILSINAKGENSIGAASVAAVPQVGRMIDTAAITSQMGMEAMNDLQEERFDRYMSAADERATNTRVYVVEKDISDSLDQTKAKVTNSDF